MVDRVNLLTDEPEQLGLFSHHWITKDIAVDAGRRHPDPPLKRVEPTPPRCWECGRAESLSYQPLWALPQLEGGQGCAPILAGARPVTQHLGGTKAWPPWLQLTPSERSCQFQTPCGVVFNLLCSCITAQFQSSAQFYFPHFSSRRFDPKSAASLSPCL